MSNHKTPSIRFKGFTDDWEQRKLGDVVSVYDGVHQTPDYKDNGIMFLSVENIATLRSEKYISEEAFKRDYKIYPQKGDILMTRIGDVGTPNVVETSEKVAFYVSLALLKPSCIDSYFLCNAIQSPLFQKGLKDRTLVTAIPQKINKDEIGKVDLILPVSTEEQTAIGEYFKNLDHLITLHQRKYEKLVNVKKSMLDKMFPKNDFKVPEIRFKGFTDDWEQRKLGNVIEIAYQGINTTADKVEYVSEGVPILQGKHITSGKIDYKDVRYLDKEKYESVYYPKYVPKVNDILLANIGTIGPLVVMKPGVELLIAWNIMLIRLNKMGDVKFVKVFLDKLNNSNFYESIMRGNATKFINKDGIMSIEIPYPTICEQEKIGAWFEQLDNLITLHQRELEKLQNLKKSLLNSMFI